MKVAQKETNDALLAYSAHKSAVEEANEYVENFDILETITNVGNDEVFTPRKVAEAMLDCLPEEVWHNPDYKWLNPASKNGVFEREIALRLDKGLAEIIPDTETRRKHILQKMIFSLGETYFTSHVARRTLYYCSDANRKCDGIKASDGHYVNGFAIGNGSWFDTSEGNILNPCTDHDFRDKKGRPKPSELTFGSADELKDNSKLKEQLDQYSCVHCGIKASSAYNVANQLERYAYEFIHVPADKLLEHLQNRFFNGDRSMKFDVIIGNPPYQLETGGGTEEKKSATQAKPIYHIFIEQAKKLKPRYLSMIIPARWYNGGMGLNQFRNDMLNDKSLVRLVDYNNSKDCFQGVDIAGGVCYFLWDCDHPSEKCVITNITGDGIITTERSLSEFGDFFIRANDSISIIKKVISKATSFMNETVSAIDTFGIPSKEKGHKEKQPGDVELLHTVGYNDQGNSYLSLSMVKKNQHLIDKFKVKISIMVPQGGEVGIKPENGYRSISTPQIVPPGMVDTFSYLNIGFFDTREEAENLVSFISTKFARYLLRTTYSSVHVSKENFCFVPRMDMTKKWADADLYDYFDLDQNERDLIDRTMRPMDLDGGDD